MVEQMTPPSVQDMQQVTERMIQEMELGDQHRELTSKLAQTLVNGGTVGDMYQLGEKDKELFYSVAHGFYTNKKYDKALPIFQFLVMFDHLNKKWWMGLAATWQMAKEYEKAINAYAMATILDATDPAPQVHAGYCLLMMGKKKEAKSALEGAVLASQQSLANHGLIKVQAEALLRTIQA